MTCSPAGEQHTIKRHAHLSLADYSFNFHINQGSRLILLVTHNLSALVARKLSGLIITAEVISDGTNEAVTGDTDYEV